MGKRGPRPLLADEKRNHCVSVRLNKQELADLDQGREKVKMQRGEYLRYASRGVIPKTIPEINREAWADLARLAANVNQQQAAINSGLATSTLESGALKELYLAIQALRLDLIQGAK